MKHNKIGAFNKLILRRKVRSTLNISSVGGKNKQIQIEVRKKRTYVQCVSQDIDNSSLKSDVECKIKNKLTNDSEIVKKELMIDKKTNNFVDSSKVLKELSLKKNNNCSEFSVLQKIISNDEINCSIEKKIKKVQDRNMSNVSAEKNKEYDRKKFGELVVEDVNTKSFDNKLRYVSILEKKDNERKLENDRRNRVRVRDRYKFSGNGKLTKQKRSNNSYRLYNIASSISDEVIDNNDQRRKRFYFPINRISKNKNKQSNNTILSQGFNKPVHKVVHNIIIGETISVSELASRMSIKGSYVVKAMMKLGLMTSINNVIDQETAQLVVEEMGHNVVLRRENELEVSIINDRDSVKNDSISILKNRAPVVTVMGHVDHGKTSLLDYIRSTKIASSEAGGITQSIGAYHVNVNNKMITFIDTPGHVAFTDMRARGVQLTDIVVLVIAADDGIMPQTIEAIKYVKDADVPVVVAINKIDKLGSNPERIQHDLTKYGLISEKWGGDIQFVHVSAISGMGINNLLDAILLQSEMLELKVAHHGLANAVVIDSFIDKGRGPVVVVLVREGMLRCGDVILCGTEYGRIRAMRNECGRDVISVGPSMPVELLGLSGIPVAGEKVIVVRDEKKAREVAFYRKDKCREIKLARRSATNNLENVFIDAKNSNVIPELYLIIKSNTQGSIEAIHNALMSLSTDKIIIRILSSSIGGITETDAVLAVTSNAMILGFNVKADVVARRIIESEELNVRYYSVIYDLLNEVKQTIKEMLIPKCKYKVIGSAEVRSVFCSPKHGNIAGCVVIEGVVKRYKKIKIIRNNVVIYSGEIESLRRFKNDVNEVRNGIECGIGIKNYNNISSGDIIEVFDVIKESNTSSKI